MVRFDVAIRNLRQSAEELEIEERERYVEMANTLEGFEARLKQHNSPDKEAH